MYVDRDYEGQLKCLELLSQGQIDPEFARATGKERQSIF
jgi:hypothetical protein